MESPISISGMQRAVNFTFWYVIDLILIINKCFSEKNQTKVVGLSDRNPMMVLRMSNKVKMNILNESPTFGPENMNIKKSYKFKLIVTIRAHYYDPCYETNKNIDFHV